jgi:hypothetical protein
VDGDGLSVGGHEGTEGLHQVGSAAESGASGVIDFALAQLLSESTALSVLQTLDLAVAAAVCNPAVLASSGGAPCLTAIGGYVAVTIAKIDRVNGEYSQGKISENGARCRDIVAVFPLDFIDSKIASGVCVLIGMS